MNSRTTLGAVGAAAALTLALTACSDSGSLPGDSTASSSGSETAAAAADTTLNLGLTSDISAPDPSSAYDGSEMNLVLAAYEGLVKYQTGVDDAEIVPSLASDWEVSDDGLTYTFTLREGVTFHDGTELTSAAIQPSIDRMLTEGDSGPAYLISDVASVDTPDDYTVVFTLDEPNAAFLDYLASPFGLKIISPTVLDEHGDDADWFATNDGGTGPFEFASFDPGVTYTLSAYDGYWGDTGGYDEIEFDVVDSTNTVQLELESGELDGYIGSGNKVLFDALADTDGIETYTYSAMMAPVVFLNPAADAFGEDSDRLAFLSGIDWDSIVSSVYGDKATTSTGVFPSSMLDSSENESGISYDADALAALEGDTIEIGYPTFVPGAQDISDNVAAQLNAAGISAESVGYESSSYWSTIFDPDLAPDVTLFSAFPDAGHPDTWAQLLYASSGGLNLFYPEVDGLDDAIAAAANSGDYSEVTDLVASSGYWYTVADLSVTSAFQEGIEGAADASYPILGITLDFTQLSPAS
ncbi:ABC transporter substrate-binding protein [Demequina salsinemoris]|uniref:ABC transporter substrate-binding protein n=1 Tax=Demequina salsinemoris TaxID=577470 RepID=UPI0007863716|nr:ABC transporter substrate-binding protein [Demequina salsinemoris]